MGCPCCDSTLMMMTVMVVYCLLQGLRSLPIAQGSKTKLCMSVFSYVAGGILFAIAILFGVLERSDDTRSWFFAILCGALSKSPHMNERRCNLLNNISGVVVEIGVGPGTNFKCYGGDTNITT
jgi:hypothetical protein